MILSWGELGGLICAHVGFFGFRYSLEVWLGFWFFVVYGFILFMFPRYEYRVWIDFLGEWLCLGGCWVGGVS